MMYQKIISQIKSQVAQIEKLAKKSKTKSQLEKGIEVASDTLNQHSAMLGNIREIKSKEKKHAIEVSSTARLMLQMEKEGFEFPDYMKRMYGMR